MFFETMRFHVEAYLLGDGMKTYENVKDLITGFDSPIASKINGGDYYAGDDFSLASATTPIFNEQIGVPSESKFVLKTGHSDIHDVG